MTDEPQKETLEDILNRMDGKRKTTKMDYFKFAPIGWQRLTDEQRTELQEMIDRFLEMNKREKG